MLRSLVRWEAVRFWIHGWPGVYFGAGALLWLRGQAGPDPDPGGTLWVMALAALLGDAVPADGPHFEAGTAASRDLAFLASRPASRAAIVGIRFAGVAAAGLLLATLPFLLVPAAGRSPLWRGDLGLALGAFLAAAMLRMSLSTEPPLPAAARVRRGSFWLKLLPLGLLLAVLWTPFLGVDRAAVARVHPVGFWLDKFPVLAPAAFAAFFLAYAAGIRRDWMEVEYHA